MDDSDDEPLALSSHALAALAEFNAEKDAHQKRFEELNAKAEENAARNVPLSMSVFEEDWNKSQFWYSDETALAYAVAVVSAPSVFIALRNLLGQYGPEQPKPKIVLLEHDDRFRMFPEFIWYDFAHPFKLPADLKGAVTRIVCDPPFLNEDCQTKAAMTVRWLASPRVTTTGRVIVSTGEPAMTVRWLASPQVTTTGRVIVSTGERMRDLIAKVYRSFGVKLTTFEPKHARGLSNEFCCYASYECQLWRWQQMTEDGQEE
ncbi:Protein-lysine N-methyltransferase EFM5 like protein [Verticillium longisporum]|nr:Protein-lysine N-methyltransferase EFM5 like protein [Verticillium longisporum]